MSFISWVTDGSTINTRFVLVLVKSLWGATFKPLRIMLNEGTMNGELVTRFRQVFWPCSELVTFPYFIITDPLCICIIFLLYHTVVHQFSKVEKSWYECWKHSSCHSCSNPLKQVIMFMMINTESFFTFF
jgi:hypothetical protein